MSETCENNRSEKINDADASSVFFELAATTIAEENETVDYAIHANPQPIIRIENLCKSFEGLKAVSDVSFEIPRGQITGVIGPNGAGKTTLFNLVTGYLKPDAGKVYFNGQDITCKPPYKIAKAGIRRTFQLVRVFPRLTVLENVLMGYEKLPGDTLLTGFLGLPKNKQAYKVCEKNARQMIEFVGLSEYADKAANDLSYGQQKLVELARALISEPKALLLDEPLSGLNVIIIEKMLELIRKVKEKGTTVIIIEHNTEVVKQISDNIVALNFGKFLAEGDPESVYSNRDVIDSYLGGEI